MNRRSAVVRRQRRRLGRAVAALALVGCGSTAWGDAWTWTGGGVAVSNGWALSLNWTPQVGNSSLSGFPVNSADTHLIFSGSVGSNAINNISNPFTLNSIVFDGTRAPITLGGGQLSFAAGEGGALSPAVFQNSPDEIDVTNPVALPTDLRFGGAGAGGLVLTGAFSGTGGLVKNGSSHLLLAGDNSAWTGRVQIDQGVVQLGSTTALSGHNSVTVNVNGGLDPFGLSFVQVGSLAGSGNIDLGSSTLAVLGDASTTYAGTLSGAAASGLVKNGLGTWTLTATGSSIGASMHVFEGVLELSGAAATLTDTSGDVANVNVDSDGFLHVYQGAHLSVTGGVPYVSGSAEVADAGSAWSNAGNVLVGPLFRGTLTVTSGGTFTSAGLTLGQMSGSQGTLLVLAGGTVNCTFLELGGGQGSGVIAMQGSGASLTAGSLFITSPSSAAGVTVSSGAAVNVTGETALSGAVPVGLEGNLVVDGGTYTTGLLASSPGLGLVKLKADPASSSALVINGASGTDTYSGVISGGGSVLKSGSSTQVFSGSANTYTGGTRVTGGTLRLGAANAAGSGALIVSAGASFDLNGFNQTVSALAGSGAIRLGSGLNFLKVGGLVDTVFSGTITGDGGLVKTGLGSLQLTGAGSSFGQLRVSSGDVTLGGGAAPSSLALTNNVTLDGGTLTLPAGAGAARVLRTPALSVTNGSRLDLADNKLIVTTPGQTGALTTLIQTGRNGGSWNGSGIVTSQSSATAGHFTSIGVATASHVKAIAATETATWAGQTVTGTDTLVMYTYGGDANLDGTINVDDYGHIDSSIALGLNGWYNGDFNYDGKINVDDYGIIDSNIGIQGAPFSTGGGTSVPLSSTGVSAVPEPMLLWLLPFLASRAYDRKHERRRRPPTPSR